MPFILNQFTVGAAYYEPTTYTAQYSYSYNSIMFCTQQGFLCHYVKYDGNGVLSNYVNIYNPSSSGTLSAPINRVFVSGGNPLAAGYDHTQNALVGFVPCAAGASSQLISLNLNTGTMVNIGNPLTDNADGAPISQGSFCSWDGTYLHIFSLGDYNIHVYDINLGTRVRKYASPFQKRTYSMQYDYSGSMYFGSYGDATEDLTTHAAKVAVGTTGTYSEGTILSLYSFSQYLVAPYTLTNTLVGWDGYQLTTHRYGTATFERFDLTQTPTVVMISPSPARVPANSSSSPVVVRVFDGVGQAVPGVQVTLSINNGTGNPVYGSIVAPATLTTGVNGSATFTYQSSNGVSGTDNLVASAFY